MGAQRMGDTQKEADLQKQPQKHFHYEIRHKVVTPKKLRKKNFWGPMHRGTKKPLGFSKKVQHKPTEEYRKRSKELPKRRQVKINPEARGTVSCSYGRAKRPVVVQTQINTQTYPRASKP